MFQFLACVICAGALAHEDVDTLIANLRTAKLPKDHLATIAAIGKLGDSGRPASASLCREMVLGQQAYGSDAISQSAARALQKVNPSLHQAILPLIGSNAKKGWKAVADVEKLRDGQDAIPLLIAFRQKIDAAVKNKRMKEPNKELVDLVVTIATLGKEDPETAGTLSLWVRSDSCADVRAQAAKELPFMKWGDDKAKKRLVKSLEFAAQNDPDAGVRQAAEASVKKIAPKK